MKRVLTYDFLKEYYLRSQVYGFMEQFNRQFFPEDYESMKDELEIMIGERSQDDKG